MAAPGMLIVVLVAAGEVSGTTSTAMVPAIREALGADTNVVVRDTIGEPTDSEALAAERRDRSDAVVELVWADARHRQATLRVHVAQPPRWVDRSITFRPSDADPERGRTLGFAVAAIFPEREAPAVLAGGGGAAGAPPTRSGQPASSSFGSSRAGGDAAARSAPAAASPSSVPARSVASSAQPSRTAPASAPTVASSPSSPPASAGAPSPPAVSDGAKGPALAAPAPSIAASGGASSPEAFETEPSSPARAPSFAADLLANGVSSGQAEGVGVEAAVHGLPLGAWLSIRASAGVLFGRTDIPSNQFTTENFTWTMATGSVGVVLTPWRSSVERPLGASIRADGWLTYTSVSTPRGLTLDGASHPFNGGPDAVADVTWMFANPFEALAGAGAAYAVFPARWAVGGAATSLGQLRAVLEAGVRTTF